MLDVEITGDKELETGLHDLGKAVADTKKPAEKAGEILAASLAKRMTTGGDPKYPDIKPASRKKRKGDKTAPALIDTGELLKAVGATSAAVPGAIWQLEPDGLTKGVEGPAVLRLQEGFHGTDRKGRKIDQAARPFLEATEADEEAITSQYDAYVNALADQYL